MPTEITQAVEAMRREMQTDRLATMSLIIDRFDKIMERFDDLDSKLDAHMKLDDTQFMEVGTRVKVLETHQESFGRHTNAIWVAIVTTMAAWGFNVFKH